MVRVYFYGVGFFLWYKVPERYISSLVLVLVSGGTSSCKTERGYVLPDTYPGATGIDIGTVDTMQAITPLAVHGMLSGLNPSERVLALRDGGSIFAKNTF